MLLPRPRSYPITSSQVQHNSLMEDLPPEEEVISGTKHVRECMALAHHIALTEDSLPSLEVAQALDAFFEGTYGSEAWQVAKYRVRASHSPIANNLAEIPVMRSVMHYYSRPPSSRSAEAGRVVHPWEDYIRLLVESTIQDLMRVHATVLSQVQARIDEVLQELPTLGEGLFDLRRGPVMPLTTAEQASLYPEQDGSSTERRSLLQDLHAARHIFHSQMYGHVGDALHVIVKTPTISLAQESTNEWNNLLLWLEDPRRHTPIRPNVKHEITQWRSAQRHRRKAGGAWKSAVRALLLHARDLVKTIEYDRVSHLVSPLDQLLEQPFMRPGKDFHYWFHVPSDDRGRLPEAPLQTDLTDGIARFRSWRV
nr:hypothetical protein CFP56_30066 [Quercus suber]